jgi:hypothetical protein
LYTELQSLQQTYDLHGVSYAVFGAPGYVLQAPLNNSDGNPYYLLSASGGLYAYDGSGSYAHTFANSTNQVGTLNASVFSNPSLLTNARAPLAIGVGSAAVTVTQPSGSPATFSVNAPAGFVGTFQVTVTATDGSLTTTQTFVVAATGTPPLPNTIAAQTVSHSSPTRNLTLGSTHSGSATVSYSATVAGYSAEYTLEQEYKFQGVGYATTTDGVKAYVLSVAGQNANGNQYYLLSSSGGLYAYDGSGSFGHTFANSANLVAQLNAADFTTPTLLTNAQAPTAPAAVVQVTGTQLTINVTGLPIGTIFQVLVTATDGTEAAQTNFLVTVSA